MPHRRYHAKLERKKGRQAARMLHERKLNERRGVSRAPCGWCRKKIRRFLRWAAQRFLGKKRLTVPA